MHIMCCTKIDDIVCTILQTFVYWYIECMLIVVYNHVSLEK